jgi:hypothetical protein
MLNRRRKLLAYLRRDNFERYCFVLHKLGLKDVYAKQVRGRGRAHPAPSNRVLFAREVG